MQTDPRVIYAAERSDGLAFVAWRPNGEQVALGVLRNGDMVASVPLVNENAAELAVKLAGANLAALETFAATLPEEACIRLAGALLAPHRDRIIGARAIVALAKARAQQRAAGSGGEVA